MITYEITNVGYRIYRDGVLWFVQENEHAFVYPGDSMEDRARNHINSLGITEEETTEEVDPTWDEAYEEVVTE